ncbi:MAG TPA: carboxypeptidase regulatory-like domain-containing protein [Acidobacteriaceae bacterium]|nr:carboxypeptidase regulatory-like domain-containing protein [Acidobacteriaceae bacterium]
MSVRRFFQSISFLLVALLAFSVPHRALAQASTGSVHGTVVDPDNALIPGATITITSASGKAQTATSKDDGTYSFKGLAAGTYTITATAPGFAAYSSQPVTVAAGGNLASDLHMDLATAAQTVNVTTDTAQLSVDPESNASSTVIQGDALNALSDDPDELESELQALAGPSAGPSGGQIYIDGFTGGQLPPKSSILAIRINSNPFSAQYDQLGYGRIEILTKPGTDKFHGNASVQGMDKVFNTASPFLGPAGQPDYHTIFSFANITGPIRPGMSFTLGGSYRDMANNNVINPPAIYSTSSDSTDICQPGQATLTTCSSNPYPSAFRAAPAPQKRWDINPRFDTMIGGKNTLTVRFESEHGSNANNGGNLSLPTQGYTSTSGDETLQLSDTQVLSDKVINETRFEWEHETNHQTPLNTATGVSVSGNFNALGTGGGSINSFNQTHYEVQNYTSIQLAKNFVRLGGRLRTDGEARSSNGGVNGTLAYSYLLDPCTDPSITNKPSGCASLNETTPCQTIVATISSYQCGTPYTFSQTTVNNLTTNARQTDGEFYAEDDWKVTPNFTWSYGLRLETQNFINSTHDFGPRTSLAWGIPRKNGRTTTVLRAGAGIFFNRFTLSQIQSIIQGDPANQSTKVYFYPGTACTPTNTSACTPVGGTSSGRVQIPVTASDTRSAYIFESAATIEQQIGNYASVSVTYLNARGVHQFLTRIFPYASAPCAYTGSASITNPNNSYIQCNQSEGVFRQNQINTNINVRTPKGTNIFGYYSANWADSNLTSITNPYNSSTDYGRASFAVRNRITIGGTIPLPFQITASPMLFAQSGSPYNITTGVDNNADGVINDRPAFASGIGTGAASCRNSADFSIPTPSVTPVQGETYTEVPINYCTGPANMALNLRLTRTFGFGPRTEPVNNGRGGGPQGGNFGAVGPGGGGGRGGRGGFGGGGGRFGGRGSNTGRKYNLTIGAQAQNLFNQIPYGTPVSNLSSAQFGKQISLSGGGGSYGSPFASANAVRRITLQMNFSF